MAQRGRKSAAALAAVNPARPSRLTPRTGLSPEVKLLWQELVASQPADHFRESDTPLLEQSGQAFRNLVEGVAAGMLTPPASLGF